MRVGDRILERIGASTMTQASAASEVTA
jgi:hypothetical protein